MGATVHLDNLTLGYDRHPAVHHLGGTFAAGSLTAVVGPNGAGKSTLLKGIAGALKPLSGAIRFDGGGGLAYLPQAAEIDRGFPISVYDLVAMGLWSRVGICGGIGRAAREAVAAALDAVGLVGFEARSIGTLSGGQMQRVLFARLLVQDARLILLDEPFTAIDARTVTDLLALVHRWHDEQRTVIAVLHDMELVHSAFPQSLLLAREPVAWGQTGDVLTPANLAIARNMAEAIDPFAPVCDRSAA